MCRRGRAAAARPGGRGRGHLRSAFFFFMSRAPFFRFCQGAARLVLGRAGATRSVGDVKLRAQGAGLPLVPRVLGPVPVPMRRYFDCSECNSLATPMRAHRTPATPISRLAARAQLLGHLRHLLLRNRGEVAALLANLVAHFELLGMDRHLTVQPLTCALVDIVRSQRGEAHLLECCKGRAVG